MQARQSGTGQPPPLPAMRKPVAARVKAAHAYAAALLRAKGTPREHRPVSIMQDAIKIFNGCHPGIHIRQPGRFIKHWYKALEERGSVEGNPGPGRKSPLLPEDADEALVHIYAGWKDEAGRKQPWVNLGHALDCNPDLRRIMRKAGLTEKSFWARLKLHDPKLCIKKLQAKPELTATQRRERRDAARRLLTKFRSSLDYFKRVFWIDAKKMYFTKLGGVTAVCRVDDPLSYAHHPMVSYRKQDMVKVYYYAVVNWFEGPVMLVPVTGTTGLDTGFKVRGA